MKRSLRFQGFLGLSVFLVLGFVSHAVADEIEEFDNGRVYGEINRTYPEKSKIAHHTGEGKYHCAAMCEITWPNNVGGAIIGPQSFSRSKFIEVRDQSLETTYNRLSGTCADYASYNSSILKWPYTSQLFTTVSLNARKNINSENWGLICGWDN